MHNHRPSSTVWPDEVVEDAVAWLQHVKATLPLLAFELSMALIESRNENRLTQVAINALLSEEGNWFKSSDVQRLLQIDLPL